MVKIVCLFTGQGAQHTDMGKQLETFSGFEKHLATYQAASVLPLQRWLFESSDEELKRTEIAQPVVYFHSLVCFSAFVERFRPSSWIYAGHSLGEYSALAAIGVLDPLKGIGAVHVRGKRMQEACPENFGGMAAVFSRNVDDVVLACETISSEINERDALVVANFNSDRQVVVSGRLECIHVLRQRADTFGFQKVIPLSVSAPFHSPYMAGIKDVFSPTCREAISLGEMKDPDGIFLPNVTGEPYKIGSLSKDLVHRLLLEQLDHCVRWNVICDFIKKYPRIDGIVEFGPKPVLSPMIKRQVACPVCFVGQQSDLDMIDDTWGLD